MKRVILVSLLALFLNNPAYAHDKINISLAHGSRASDERTTTEY